MNDKENIVYYNGFWYSSFSPIGSEPYNMIIDKRKQLGRIKSDMRLLALIFDIIHIPRSHLLTFHTNHNWEVIEQYLCDNDWQFFVDNNIVLSSSLPYIDEYSDTERIVERIKNKNWSKEVDDKFIKSVKGVTSIKIDSIRESKGNVDRFQQYIELLKGKNREIGNELDEIKKRSEYRTIPFLHEIFIEELYKNRKIDAQSKETIWRFTNSLYIHTGGLDLGDKRRINFDGRIEDKESTHDNAGLLRELYSPKFIEALIIEELGDKYLVKYLNNDISEIMKFRDVETWDDFKSDIFEMFETLNQLEKIRPLEFAKFTGQQRLLAYKKYILGEDKSKFAQLIADLMVVASDVYDPVAGKTIKTVKGIIAGKLLKKYSEWQVSKKLKSYKAFWKKLKTILDEIN